MSLTTSLTRTQASKVLEGGRDCGGREGLWREGLTVEGGRDCGGREGLSYVLESVRPFISASIDISTDHPHTSASIFLLTGTLASTGKRYTLEEDEALWQAYQELGREKVAEIRKQPALSARSLSSVRDRLKVRVCRGVGVHAPKHTHVYIWI